MQKKHNKKGKLWIIDASLEIEMLLDEVGIAKMDLPKVRTA